MPITPRLQHAGFNTNKKAIIAFIIGVALGIGITLAFTRDRYQYFTSPTYGNGRINTKTGQTWLMGQSGEGYIKWVEVLESK